MELTDEQRIQSFIGNRISSRDDNITFTRKELAEFCLKEIDYAIEIVKNVSYEDIGSQDG